MSYSIVQSAVNPPTQTTATAFFSASNDRPFGIRIFVTANGVTVFPSTLINVGGFLDGNATATGLIPGNTYAFVMTIRRNSNNEDLGTRTVNISTTAAPPPSPPSWSSNFPSGQTGNSYSGNATVTFPTGGTWGFLTAPSIPGLSLSQGLSSFSLSGTPTVAGTYNFSARATDEFTQSTDASFSITINSPPAPTGTVPGVLSFGQAAASSAISNAGFNPVIGTATTSGADSSNNGTVASQSPGGGQTANLGSNVTISLFNFVPPQANVANVVGSSEASARSTLQGQGFSVSASPDSVGANAGNNGQVKSQVPAAGTAANVGSNVALTIFNFVAPTTAVPNVLGQAQATAVSNIQSATLVASVTSTTAGATSGNNNTVASQSPGGGTTVQQNSQVNLTVFNFVPPTGAVPNVVGQASSTATTNIQNAGFGVTATTTTSGATSGNNNTVASQNPAGGTTANLTSNVAIVVFNFVAPSVTVPNVVGQNQAQATSTLQGAGFAVSTGSTTSGANSSNNGTVATQTPSGGSSANSGSTVTISIFTFNPPVWTDNVIVNNFVLGTSYSDSVAATNSPSYTITSGTLPVGISLNSITGAITGTPTTAGQYSFVISATNSFGSVSVSYNGDITAPPVWSDQTLADFSQGRTYSDGVVATNSPSYSVSAGTLPLGISLNSATGAVTGTPTGTGAYNFTIRAANSFGAITANFTGSIKLPPNWIDNQLGSFINEAAYSDSVSASNSPTYAVSAGVLPAGTSLASATGIISGTVTALVNSFFSFTITATNSEGSISQAFTGTVQPDLGGNLKLFADGAWSDKEVYVYSGTAWVRGTVNVFNGTSWSKSVF